MKCYGNPREFLVFSCPLCRELLLLSVEEDHVLTFPKQSTWENWTFLSVIWWIFFNFSLRWGSWLSKVLWWDVVLGFVQSASLRATSWGQGHGRNWGAGRCCRVVRPDQMHLICVMVRFHGHRNWGQMRLHKPRIYIIKRRFSWSVETWACWPFSAGASTSKKSFLSTCFQWESQDYGGQFCLDPDADCGWQCCGLVCLFLITRPLPWPLQEQPVHTQHLFLSASFGTSASALRPTVQPRLCLQLRRQAAPQGRTRRDPSGRDVAGRGQQLTAPAAPRCRAAGPSRAELPGALLRALRVRKTQFNISLKNKNKQTNKQQRNRNIRTQNTKNHKINRYLLRVVNISIGKVWFLCSSDFPLLSLEGSNLKLQGKFWKTGQRSTSSPRALGLSMVGSCLFSSAKIACISLAGHWV